MSKIIFGNSIDLLTAGTPSSGGYIVAYDLDGIIKQKDEFGVITPIGGGPTAGGITASLSQTLVVGNTTNGTDIVTSNDDVIIAATGGAVLNLRYNSNGSVLLGLPSSGYGGKGGNGNGGGLLSLDPSAITLGLNGADFSKPYIYMTTQYSQFADYSTHSSVYYGFNLYRNSSFNSYSNGISIKENVTFNFTSANQNNYSIIIGSRNSTTNAGVYNSPVIGGQGLSATQSNTVYLGNTININNAYKLPNSDGSSGQVLTTDGSGTSYWDTPSTANNFATNNLTFTGDRDHNTNGYYYSLTTDGGLYLESWHYLDSTINQLGFDTNQIFFTGTTSIDISFQNRKRLTFLESETVINQDSYDLDFRIEGATDSNLLFIDASSDSIGIGNNTPSYKLQVTGTVSTTGFRMTNGASSGYLLQSDSSGNATWVSATSVSANFANTDLTFTGNRSHNINGNILEMTTDNGGYSESWYYMDSSELSLGWGLNQIGFSNGIGSPLVDIRTGSGSTSSRIRLNSLETVINESGYAYDFRVEGDTDSNLLFVDASTDTIGIGAAALSTVKTYINSDKTYGLSVQNTQSNSITLQVLQSGSGASTGMQLSVSGAGSLNTGLTIDSTGATTNRSIVVNSGDVIFNNGAGNYDFTVKGDTDSYLLFVDASNDAIGVGTNTVFSSEKLRVQTSNSSQFTGLVVNSILYTGFYNYGVRSTAQSPSSYNIGFDSNVESGSVENIAFQGIASATNSINKGLFTQTITNNTSSNYGVYVVSTNNTGTAYGVVVESGTSIFNESGNNYDFRIEGMTESNLFFVDASSDNIGIGNNTPNYRLHVTGTVSSTTGFNTNGLDGWTGTFSADGQIVTVTGGIITSVV